MTSLRPALVVLVSLAFGAVAGCGARDAAPAGEVAAPAPAVAAAGLGEAQVRDLVEAIEAATVRKDVHGQAAYFAEDAMITTVSPAPGGGVDETARTRAEYVEAELRSHASMPDSAYESRIAGIDVAADGRYAHATVLAEQSMRLDGKDARASAEQVFTIELRDGKPVVVAVRNTLTGLTVDGNKVF